MPKLAVNLTMLFTEVPFLDRFAKAAEAGFTAVEFQFPYDFAAADIAERLERHNLHLVLFNIPAGDWAADFRQVAYPWDAAAGFAERFGRPDVARALRTGLN